MKDNKVFLITSLVLLAILIVMSQSIFDTQSKVNKLQEANRELLRIVNRLDSNILRFNP